MQIIKLRLRLQNRLSYFVWILMSFFQSTLIVVIDAYTKYGSSHVKLSSVMKASQRLFPNKRLITSISIDISWFHAVIIIKIDKTVG